MFTPVTVVVLFCSLCCSWNCSLVAGVNLFFKNELFYIFTGKATRYGCLLYSILTNTCLLLIVPVTPPPCVTRTITLFFFVATQCVR